MKQFFHFFIFLLIIHFVLITQNIDILKLDYSKIEENLNFLQKAENLHLSSWKRYYHILPNLINNNNLKIGCEIGVAFGNHSFNILKNSNIQKLYSVDAYQHFDDQEYCDPMNFDQDKFDLLYHLVQKKLSIFNDQSNLIRKSSIEAAKIFNENELDFIFLDANHTYKNVKEDLESWYDKVKPGGYIIGDDYNHEAFPGVKQAVDEFFEKKALNIIVDSKVKEIYIVKKPKHFLSFIIPCYNCEKTIEESINSIYEQNLSVPFEVICTNDASNDSTLKLLNEFAKKLTNLKVFSHIENKGGAAARNTCVKNSKGDLIFCLDSDNVLVANSVNKLIKLLDELKIDAVAFQDIKFFKNNFELISSWKYKIPNNISNLKHFFTGLKTPPTSGNYLYTKESYINANGYPENSGALDTWTFGLAQYASGSKIGILPNSFYWHRLQDDSYWIRDNQNECLLKQKIYNLLEKFNNIFTDETINYLKYCKQNNLHFYEEVIPQNKIKLKNKGNFFDSILPNPYKSLKVLNYKMNGWFGEKNKINLVKLINENKPKVVVELGSWLGLSCTFIAQQISQESTIYAIDTWLGSAEHHKTHEFAINLPDLYQQFLSNIVHLKLTDKVVPIRMSTQEAAKALNIQPDLIYVDASHEENDVYNDIMSWYAKLNDNGIMCGDDWAFESVKKAVLKAVNELNQKIHFDDNFWWFDKKI